jgi:hypothetical protein
VICAATGASADSAFELAYPSGFGRIPAYTYDKRGEPIGEANVVIELLEAGSVRITSRSSSRRGARTVATAWFAAVKPKKTVRLVRQESSSLDPQGRPIGHLVVDHTAQLGTCTTPDAGTVERVRLPSLDRIVNVPMNLFFLPLVRGEASSLKFQLFLCRNGARTMDFEAWVEQEAELDQRPIEVRYAPDHGGFWSMIARSFAPRLSFWFDPAEPHGWMGHRVPLYSGGPEVLVVREGVPTTWLVD